jgi:hypothetical protein
MTVPAPEELLERYGPKSPEALAAVLGFTVVRESTAPTLPGVTVFSEYRTDHVIVLYEASLRQDAARRDEPLPRLEQWHIAHELYHGLAEDGGGLPWRVSETAADLWADELLALCLHQGS